MPRTLCTTHTTVRTRDLVIHNPDPHDWRASTPMVGSINAWEFEAESLANGEED
jgi:hypothetical protein